MQQAEAQKFRYHENYFIIDLTMVIKMAKKSMVFILFGTALLLLMALLPLPQKKVAKTIIPQEVKSVVQTVENTLQRADIKLGAVQEVSHIQRTGKASFKGK
jgi:hypothetical protein